MSVVASGWAWEQDIPFGEKLVLLAIADWAMEGDECLYAQKKLAAKIGMSERALRDNIARLEERGLLVREERYRGNGSQTSNRIVLTRLREDAGAADAAGGGGGAPPGRGGGSQPPQRRKEGDGPSSSAGTAASEMELTEGVSGVMEVDARSLLEQRVKVAGRRVTAEEMGTAASALAEFNRCAEQVYGLGAHLTGIVGRIRERPSFKGQDHVRLVQSAWRLRWWEKRGGGRRPTPAVIYGNAAVFEQVIADATDEKAGRVQDAGGERPKKFVRKGPRREI